MKTIKGMHPRLEPFPIDKPVGKIKPSVFIRNGKVEKLEESVKYLGKSRNLHVYKGPYCKHCNGDIGTLCSYDQALAYQCVGLSCIIKKPR